MCLTMLKCPQITGERTPTLKGMITLPSMVSSMLNALSNGSSRLKSKSLRPIIRIGASIETPISANLGLLIVSTTSTVRRGLQVQR